MRINGEWMLADDGTRRPIVYGEIAGGDGSLIKARFQVDPAAERTVFSWNVLQILNLEPVESADMLAGLGGIADSVVLETQLCLFTDKGTNALFRGQFAAVTAPESLDMSLLGRDILNHFAVIIDRPGDIVCLLGQRHHYRIEER
jgi:hypothetical protein